VISALFLEPVMIAAVAFQSTSR